MQPRRCLLAVLTTFLLVISFPGWGCYYLAWFAFIPWFFLLRELNAKQAFLYSIVIGAGFFLISMRWLTHVTVVGWVVLSVYLGAYFGAFGAFVAYCELLFFGDRESVVGNRSTIRDPRSTKSEVLSLLGIPAFWVALEWLRGVLLSGMPWNLLAYSQTPWPSVIQIADCFGAWGVSYLVVLVNVLLFWALALRGARRWIPVAAAVTAPLLACAYGAARMRALSDPPPGFNAVLVQGNIPQTEKWDPEYQAGIMQKYEELTLAALRPETDLVIWPETSVPGYWGIDEPLTNRVLELTRRVGHSFVFGVPALFGYDTLYNRAILMDPEGDVRAVYDKLHLVPLGEFVPFERTFPWLRQILPPIGTFSPGQAMTVFSPPREGERLIPDFGVLICFEDVFSGLAGEWVRRGARWLLVITNDAWFGPTAAAYQHAQASAFRAVEYRVPVLRAANTGWTGCIDALGRAYGEVEGPGGAGLFVDGSVSCEVRTVNAKTLYRRWGPWWAVVCLIMSAALIALRLRPVPKGGSRFGVQGSR